MKFKTIFLNLCFLPVVSGFYKKGHELIGEMTDIMLSKDIKDNIGLSIEKVSSWADSIRRDRSYSWANNLHFIVTPDDAEKNFCDIPVFDDKERNLYTALQNYTSRLLNKEERQEEDLKFFVHFYQDMFQPLHISGIYRGGNQYKVDFFGRKGNLHEVWDYLILRNRMNEKGGKEKYMKYLLEYSKNIQPLNSFDFKYWMRRNNRLNCEFVYNNISFNITEAYYDKNKYLIDHLMVFSAVNLQNILTQLYK